MKLTKLITFFAKKPGKNDDIHILERQKFTLFFFRKKQKYITLTELQTQLVRMYFTKQFLEKSGIIEYFSALVFQ